MKDILNELDSAFQLIASIPVSHNNVEIMATAKSKLRTVYAEIQKMSEEVGTNGDSNG